MASQEFRDGDGESPPVIGDAPLDAFAFCNHLAWEIGGPVLIHDADWGTFAYSTLNQPIDDGRRAAILRRAIPPEHYDSVIHAYAIDAMQRGDHVFEVHAVPGVQTRRLVGPIRLHGVPVGSIWVSDSAGPLHPDADEILAAAAKQASIFFQVHREQRKREAEVFLGMLLDGGQDVSFVGQYLGLPTDSRLAVLAVEAKEGHDLPEDVTSRITGAFRAASIKCMGIVRGATCFVLLYDTPAEQHSAETLSGVLQAISAKNDSLIMGIGDPVFDLRRLPRSRRDAEDVVHYLRAAGRQRAAMIVEVKSGVTLMRVARDLGQERAHTRSTLDGLRHLEPLDKNEAIATLDAYFEFMGNASEAARQLHLHPNTFRYRLAKISDTLGIDLSDRDTRLLVQLDLLRGRYSGSQE